ncbi:MAG TPA: type II secretion system F family protein [Candidatus Saccharimonadales bacterium]|nr:type II secretion system F family protein [Candidatus Saccharimonadales bacterium]
MLLAYKALSTDGKTVTGTVDVASKEDLIASLHRQNLRPLTITVDKTRHTSGSKKKKVKLQDLVIFTRQLSTMISAGVPLARSLSALEGDAENPFLREVLAQVTKDVQGGMSLEEAFKKHPTVFNDVYVNMVRAGEEGGILDEILKRLALQVEQDASIRKKIKSAMMYPIVILTVTVFAFFGIMLFIVPKISKILKDLGGPNAKLPIYTQYMLDASNFCVRPTIVKAIPGLNMIPLLNKAPNLIFLLLILGVIGIYALRYIKTEEGKYKFHALLLRIPIVKIVILKVAISRFARTFASLMGSGVSVLDALDVTGAALGNKVIEKELKEAALQVKNGKQLSEPLSKSPHFPPIISQMLMVGEETGQMDTVLVKVADFYDEEVSVLIDGLAAVIEPVMIIFLGAAVGLIAASVMGPIANLSKNIGNS